MARERFVKTVPYEIALKLSNLGNYSVGMGSEFRYVNCDNFRITFDNYLGVETKRRGDLILYEPSGENYHGEYILAPSYGEVFDWFENQRIIITIIPHFTYAFQTNISYTYVISTINDEEAKLDEIHWRESGSFDTCSISAIEEAIKIYKEKNGKN